MPHHQSPYSPNNHTWKNTNPFDHNHFHKEVKKVSKPVTLDDLFPKLDRWAIGYNHTFDTLQELAKIARTQSYPPYNITKFDDGKFKVEVALAGFRKEDVKISVEDRTLTVSSDVEASEEVEEGKKLHHGIAQRNFTQTFALAEYVEVDSARLEDGILTIDLVTNLPEEKKPKSIEIK